MSLIRTKLRLLFLIQLNTSKQWSSSIFRILCKRSCNCSSLW